MLVFLLSLINQRLRKGDFEKRMAKLAYISVLIWCHSDELETFAKCGGVASCDGDRRTEYAEERGKKHGQGVAELFGAFSWIYRR